jgi:imidazolonepropionase-like amidohydrolase
MKIVCSLLLLPALPFLSLAQPKTVVFTHVTVIDATSAPPKPDMIVVITGGRIAALGPPEKVPVPKGAQVIDATGMFLIPGLWDMHVHLSYYGQAALPMLVANGVTGVRDMGGDLTQIDRWRIEIARGVRFGPRIFRAGPFVDGPKKMNPRRASFTRVVTTEAEARRVVISLKRQGVDFIKVHSRVPREAFFALADEARKQGLPLVTHVPKDVTAAEASDAGTRSIEHTESLLGDAIYEEQEGLRERRTEEAFNKLGGGEGAALFARLVKGGTWYDPTLISLYRVKGTAYEKDLAPKLLPVVRELHRAGVPLLTGSDFGGKEAGIRPGFDLHDELVLFVRAGMTPMQALQAATLNPAKCLNVLDSLGTVEKGKIADLVLLEADPLQEISNTRKIAAVVVGGRLLLKKSLEKMLADVGATANEK